MTEKQIIRAIRSDEDRPRTKALKKIYELCYYEIEFLVTNNSGSKTDAADIFQDTMVIFYKNIVDGKFMKTSTLKTYFYGIAKNLWLRQLKKKGRRTGYEQEYLAQQQQAEPSLLDVSLLRGVFDELKADCQQLLSLFYYHNKSIREIQKRMNMNSEQVVKNKKGRCIKYLMNIVKQRRLNHASFINE